MGLCLVQPPAPGMALCEPLPPWARLPLVMGEMAGPVGVGAISQFAGAAAPHLPAHQLLRTQGHPDSPAVAWGSQALSRNCGEPMASGAWRVSAS